MNQNVRGRPKMNLHNTIPYMIVEPGGTHEGQYLNCLVHLNQAYLAGAHAVKMQWLSNPDALAKQRNAQQYVHAYQNIAFPASWHEEFKLRLEKDGMDYGCSVFLEQDVKVVAPYVDFFKVSSFEAANLDLIRAMAIYKKPIIVSLGMRNYDETLTLILVLIDLKLEAPLHFLYCVTGYPVPIDQLNLSVLSTGMFDGLSDHSADVTVGARAYAAGVRIFEVHVRNDNTPMTNADYPVSLSYAELQKYVENIKEQERYFGSPQRKVQDIERGFLQYKY